VTGLEVDQGLQTAVAVAVLVVLVLGAGAGAVLRATVTARVAASSSRRVRALGSAWVNVPASALAASALVLQLRLGLLPGEAPAPLAVGVVAVIGLCGGFSTYSTLALELSRSLLGRRRRDLVLQLGGVAVGVAAGLFGAGLAGVLLLLR